MKDGASYSTINHKPRGNHPIRCTYVHGSDSVFYTFIAMSELPMAEFIPFNVFPGWLIKEGRVRRKRFFILTENYQLRYYKSEDTRQPVTGVIHLNWYAKLYYLVYVVITLHYPLFLVQSLCC